MTKYTLTVHRGGSCGEMPVPTLKDLNAIINYILSEAAPGDAVKLTIEKNKK